MKRDKRVEIKVGVSVLIAILIFLFVLAWAKNLTLFSDPKELSIRFDLVAGLTQGDQVSINGVKKGYVEQIKIDGNSVKVNILLDEDVDLRSDASFSIMMLDLMGGKKLEISPGTSNQPIDYSVIHNGQFLGDISTAMAMLSGMQENIKTIVDELSITLNAVNGLVNDKKFMDDVKNSVSELRNMSSNISQVITENRVGIRNLIDSSSAFVASGNLILRENQESIGQTLEKSIVLIENSSNLVKKMDTLLKEIKSGENNAGKLLYDEEFLINLKTSLENVKKLTRQLIDQLEGEGINVDANLDLF